MKTKGFILVIIAIACFTNLKARKLSEGTLYLLKEIKKLRVVFNPSRVLIQGKTEEVTFAIKGETWARKWEEAKIATFSKRLLGHLNKNLSADTTFSFAGQNPGIIMARKIK